VYMQRPSVVEGLVAQSEIGLLPVYAVQQVSNSEAPAELATAEDEGVAVADVGLEPPAEDEGPEVAVLRVDELETALLLDKICELGCPH